MGGGHEFQIEAMRDKKKPIHPMWAGVGCFMLVGLSTAGYLLGTWFITANGKQGWILLPSELAVPPENPFLFIKLSFALIVVLLGSAILSILYVVIHPPKPGRFDVIDASIFPPMPKRRK